MPSLLKIDVSPRGDASYSRKIGNDFLQQWQTAHAGGTVTTRDLAKQQPSYVDLQWIGGAFTKPEDLTPEHKAALQQSNDIIAEAKAADTILITTPMYNFQIPAVLKAWIDHLVRAGQTFQYTDKGPQGLLTGKKVVVAVASAGDYRPGQAFASYDLLTPYLKQILGFIGLTDVTFIKAGSTRSVDSGQQSLDEWKQPLQEQVQTLATA